MGWFGMLDRLYRVPCWNGLTFEGPDCVFVSGGGTEAGRKGPAARNAIVGGGE